MNALQLERRRISLSGRRSDRVLSGAMQERGQTDRIWVAIVNSTVKSILFFSFGLSTSQAFQSGHCTDSALSHRVASLGSDLPSSPLFLKVNAEYRSKVSPVGATSLHRRNEATGLKQIRFDGFIYFVEGSC